MSFQGFLASTGAAEKTAAAESSTEPGQKESRGGAGMSQASRPFFCFMDTTGQHMESHKCFMVIEEAKELNAKENFRVSFVF